MHGPFWLRLGTRVVKQLGSYQPKREIPRNVSGLYGRSLHRDHDGEWDYDLAWKPLESWPVYAGWLRAIRRAHARAARRPRPATVPCWCSPPASTPRPTEMSEDVHTHDIVLDVRQIRRWATALGPHVTVVSIEGARHDVVLSRPEPGPGSTTSSAAGTRRTSAERPHRRRNTASATTPTTTITVRSTGSGSRRPIVEPS